MKNMPHTFSINFTCLQITLFETGILYSFWAIPPNKTDMHRWNIFLIAVVSMPSSPQIKMVKPPKKRQAFLTGCLFCVGVALNFQFVWQKLCYNIPLARLLQKYVGLCDSSAKYQKSFVCLCKMCFMVVLWKRMFYRDNNLTTTCQCRQLKLNLLSTQINIYCLMTNQTPALLV